MCWSIPTPLGLVVARSTQIWKSVEIVTAMRQQSIDRDRDFSEKKDD